MKIVIAGSRTITDKERVFPVLDTLIPTGPVLIVSGGAGGVDTLAIDYAKEKGYPYRIFYAKWRNKGRFDRGAGFKRNAEMADFADVLIAFWDGHSNGTQHMIGCMESRKKTYRVITLSPTEEVNNGDV